ncbi:hypothetical protein ABZ484_37340 [Streptomyces sp. NPDC006393]|uniref:hypothetical protein n=1 Tax=Streptomyces sp. NPDC006393 TaxID=3156763 RepID=UPI0033C9CC41
MTGGALLAWAPGADAATLATPDAPRLLSATVSGCQAPCAPGESGQVALTFTDPAVPAGETIGNRVYADGVPVDPIASRSGSPEVLYFSICSGIRRPFEGCLTQQQVDAVRGGEVFTVTARAYAGNPDDGTAQVSAESAPSNGLVPTQQ